MEQVYINLKDMNECFTKRYLQETLKKDLVSVNELIGLIEDLKGDYDVLQEKYEDLEQDMRDNYKPISVEEQIGYSERW